MQRNHRAKRIDTGKWIEGWYSSYSDFRGNGYYQIRSDNGYQNDVDFTTVCQYIGFLDREENRVYENDIVEFIYSPKTLNEKVIGKVCLDDWGNWVIDNGKALYHIKKVAEGLVIGNIYDNPDLLSGSEV